MKQFKLCTSGCGCYGAFKNGVCDSCRRKREIERMTEREQRRKAVNQ